MRNCRTSQSLWLARALVDVGFSGQVCQTCFFGSFECTFVSLAQECHEGCHSHEDGEARWKAPRFFFMYSFAVIDGKLLELKQVRCMKGEFCEDGRFNRSCLADCMEVALHDTKSLWARKPLRNATSQVSFSKHTSLEPAPVHQNNLSAKHLTGFVTGVSRCKCSGTPCFLYSSMRCRSCRCHQPRS